MRALERLVELLRIAEQDEAVRRSCDRDHVGQRDLAGLVDEQDVDRVDHLRRRPQPRRAGGEVGAPIVEPRPDIRRVLPGASTRSSTRTCSVVALLDRVARATPSSAAAVEDRPQEVADDLVARAGDADPLAGGEQGADHPGPGVGLARAGWTLDRQRRVVERDGQPARGIEVGSPSRRSPSSEPLTRPAAAAGRAGRARLASARTPGSRGRRPTAPRSYRAAWWSFVRTQFSGTIARGCGSATTRLRSTVRAAGSATASVPTTHLNGDSFGRACLLAGSYDLAPPEVVVLRREPVPPGLLALLLIVDRPDRLQQPDRVVLVDELLRGQVEQPMELPPHRLVLATVPAEELGEQPRRLLRLRPVGRVGRHALGSGQAVDERLDARLALGQVGRQLGVARDGARERTGPVAAVELVPAPLQPVAQTRSC